MQVLTVDFTAPSAPQDFCRSLEETGFAILANHPIPWSSIETVYREWLQFFHAKERFDYLLDVKHQDGYVPSNLSETAKGATIKDLKEFYQLYFPWGRYPAMLSDTTREVFNALFRLGQFLLTWLEAYMPEAIQHKLSEPLAGMLMEAQTQLRILHYPPLTGAEEANAIRAAAHEDINLITLLPASTEPGLQVMDKEGQWIDVGVDKETLIVNIGDMLQEASGHFYRSTTHRVINPEGLDSSKPRLSLPLFIHPRPDVKLSNRYTAATYLDERLREIGLKM